MAAMFGCIVAGRLVKTDAQPVSENQILFQIEDCENVNHIVVFLTGAQPFPDGFGGLVYFCWPQPEPSWRLLGYLTNEKPSAIFKISKMKSTSSEPNPFGIGAMNPSSTVAQIGIAIETLTHIAYQTPDDTAQASKAEELLHFSQKALTNLFNFCASFATSNVPNPSETFIPMSVFQNWYTTFQRKLSMDANFWKSL